MLKFFSINDYVLSSIKIYIGRRMRMIKVGSQWGRWDLHIHTPQTKKADKFEGKTVEEKWDKFYEHIRDYVNPDDPQRNIVALGITDYLSIDNYQKVVNDDRLPSSIELVIPNVELRLTLKGSQRPINIHCLFNPDFVDQIENRFFSELKVNHLEREFNASRAQLISLGKELLGGEGSEEDAYVKGIENFVIQLDQLTNVLKNNKDLRDNIIVVVANKGTDGASGLAGQMEIQRQGVYRQSDAIFSGNPKDIKYFLGYGADSYEVLKGKIGGIKPCFHGSDAHDISKMFEPDKKRYCYIKSELTFDGLKQTLTDPEDRVFIGEIPEVLVRIQENPEKIISKLSINKTGTHKGWFESTTIEFNPQLNVVIGNKGSGKTAIADMVGLGANSDKYENYAFLSKFRETDAASGTKVKLSFLNGVETEEVNLSTGYNQKSSLVKYLPQAYFEDITNEYKKIEGFRSEIENVIFQYLSDENKQGAKTFSEYRKLLLDADRDEIQRIQNNLSNVNSEIIELENKMSNDYLNKIKSDLSNKKEIIEKHQENIPKRLSIEVGDMNETNKKELEKLEERIHTLEKFVSSVQDKLAQLSMGKREITDFKTNLEQRIEYLDQFFKDSSTFLAENEIDIDSIFSYTVNYDQLDQMIEKIDEKIDRYNEFLSMPQNDSSKVRGNSISGKITLLKTTLNEKISKESHAVQEAKRKEREYQQWEQKLLELKGNEIEPDYETEKYLENEMEYIQNKLPADLEILEESRMKLSSEIMDKKKQILSQFQDTTTNLQEVLSNTDDNNIKIVNSFFMSLDFGNRFLSLLNRRNISSFRGIDGEELLMKRVSEQLKSENDFGDIKTFLATLVDDLRYVNREGDRVKADLSYIKDRQALYDYLFGLDYIENEFDLKVGEKDLDQLSPGERGAVLLIFYLLLDQDNDPLIIDQPEDNLDNQSVADILVPYIKRAKQRRQIIMVTHNPNLAVVSDAEQVIGVSLKKESNNQFSFITGGIENKNVNKKIQDILEGTPKAFRIRDSKYYSVLG